ncbi:MAG: hypothetical protein ACFWTJ_12140 [Lachnoclostridium sp.]
MATFIVGIIVLGGIAFSGYKTYKSRKTGGGCGCGCSGCSKAAKYHKE